MAYPKVAVIAMAAMRDAAAASAVGRRRVRHGPHASRPAAATSRHTAVLTATLPGAWFGWLMYACMAS